ncbi:VOC family protein [Amycolatopsis pithecellobii]|uniref:Glyoxalase/bleomycin resistance/extradiol dioxygenase family protein n=1 Tax=Amycolatopsis pithecellobii TaxID=664692 RepID=A0A6N7Z8Q8_9PSEU|nr:VOC family protein [Amycolatopsis pithecellobii]MTD56986.1 glyoxalase/bleomycin resistance/extradiol dioxygenase family protein [Amycolatopsis pithecellobii]
MSTKIFVNLPVKDLGRAQRFYTELGYSLNPQFTDENAACVVISEEIYVMLLTEPFFKNFTSRDIVDTATGIEVINALSADSRQQVDELVDKALAAGGTVANEPMDMGFMYSRSFHDLDGHNWEAVYMDPNHVQQ